MTINDIAERAGVSISTVSKIINGKDSAIKSETRERVLKIVKEYRYAPYDFIKNSTRTKKFLLALVLSGMKKNPSFQNGFLCEDCAAQYDSALTNRYNGGSDGYNTAGSAYDQAGLFSIGAQGLAYLQALCEQSPKQVRSLVLEDESMRRLHDFLYYLIENCAGTKLKTLATGKGIL